VTPAPSMLGTNLQNVSGSTGNGYINEIYGVTGTSPGNYTPGNCHIIIPATTWVAGKLWTCLLVLGTPTTQNASALCSNSYTTTGTSWPGGDLIISMASCPALPPDQGYWVGSTTNQTTASPTQGFSNCSGSCSGAPPTFGSGTYAYRYVANTFGNYTSLPTTLSASAGTQQVSQYIELTTTPMTSANLPLSITTPPPSLVSAYLTAGSGSMTVGGTMQMAAKCHYTSGPDQDCTVTDIYGDAVSAWLSSDPTKATVNNVSASNPGLVTAVAAGTPSITATIGTGTTSSAYPITINNPPVTLTGVSLSLTGGVTGLFVGATNHLKATCTYSDGSSDDCTTTDVHGYLAHNYASTTPAHATVNATSGLVTGVAPGATTFTAVAGSFTSNALPLNVFPVLSGVYTITVSGPVKFSGTVQF
jgi:Bacterial Ig-like domain (group 2)